MAKRKLGINVSEETYIKYKAMSARAGLTHGEMLEKLMEKPSGTRWDLCLKIDEQALEMANMESEIIRLEEEALLVRNQAITDP